MHKSGKHVFGLGWFHDAVASTKKRAVTAPGNSVVLGLAVSVPFTERLFCLPIHAKLRRAGKAYPGLCPEPARAKLPGVGGLGPRTRVFGIADGGYSAGKLLNTSPLSDLCGTDAKPCGTAFARVGTTSPKQNGARSEIWTPDSLSTRYGREGGSEGEPPRPAMETGDRDGLRSETSLPGFGLPGGLAESVRSSSDPGCHFPSL